ncbi:UNVERIFIED_ORG: hypothetical protein ABID57_001168 [Arthrobacter sp. UYEF1]
MDEWRRQAVSRPEDASGGGTRQEHFDGLILTAPETADGSPVAGRHADVVPLDAAADVKERALIIYITHPHWNGEDIDAMAADPKTHRWHRSDVRPFAAHIYLSSGPTGYQARCGDPSSTGSSSLR